MGILSFCAVRYDDFLFEPKKPPRHVAHDTPQWLPITHKFWFEGKLLPPPAFGVPLLVAGGEFLGDVALNSPPATRRGGRQSLTGWSYALYGLTDEE